MIKSCEFDLSLVKNRIEKKKKKTRIKSKGEIRAREKIGTLAIIFSIPYVANKWSKVVDLNVCANNTGQSWLDCEDIRHVSFHPSFWFLLLAPPRMGRRQWGAPFGTCDVTCLPATPSRPRANYPPYIPAFGSN